MKLIFTIKFLLNSLFLALLLSCSSSSFSLEQKPLPLQDGLIFKKCQLQKNQRGVKSSECAHLEVPLNPAKPSAGNITLNILRVPAIKQTTASPLFILAGGPGQAATELASMFTLLFREVLQRHDLVFVDQRGTGQSNPLDCDLEAEKLDGLNPPQKQTALLKAYKKCIHESIYADNPSHFAFYTTPYAVNDLEAIRKALGYKRINLWGASYGTRVGLHYLRQYPEAIRSAVLDGSSPLNIALPRWTNRDSSRALANILTRCKKQTTCDAAFPNLKQDWLALLAKLKAQPRTHTLSHPRTQKQQSVYIDHQTLSSWSRFALYVREFSPLLPKALHEAAQLNFQLLYSIAIQGSQGMEDGISMLMHMAVICNEDFVVNGNTPKPANTSNEPLLLDADSSQYRYACPLFNVQSTLPTEQTRPITSTAPVLLLSGELDPATPPIWGDYVHHMLPNSQHILVAGGHHGISALGCITQIIAQFIDRGTLDGLQTDCTSGIKAKAFFIDNAGPAMAGNIENNALEQVSK